MVRRQVEGEDRQLASASMSSPDSFAKEEERVTSVASDRRCTSGAGSAWEVAAPLVGALPSLLAASLLLLPLLADAQRYDLVCGNEAEIAEGVGTASKAASVCRRAKARSSGVLAAWTDGMAGGAASSLDVKLRAGGEGRIRSLCPDRQDDALCTRDMALHDCVGECSTFDFFLFGRILSFYP